MEGVLTENRGMEDSSIDSDEKGGAVEPSPFDILLGRGKSNMNHSGNQRFRALIKANNTQYSCAEALYEKAAIISKVLRMVTEKGRFLKRDETGSYWVAVSPQAARTKVAHALQYRVRRKAKAELHLRGQRVQGQAAARSTGGDAHSDAVMYTPSQEDLPAKSQSYASLLRATVASEQSEHRSSSEIRTVQPRDASRGFKAKGSTRSWSSSDHICSARVSPCRQDNLGVLAQRHPLGERDALRPLAHELVDLFERSLAKHARSVLGTEFVPGKHVAGQKESPTP